jgi:hypothetical protein
MANADGSDRQEIISRCSRGEILNLVREPDNPHDKNAVLVRRATGQALGYLGAHTVQGSKGVARRMDEGVRYQVRVKDITGRDPKGVNVELAYWDGPIENQPTEVYFPARSYIHSRNGL